MHFDGTRVETLHLFRDTCASVVESVAKKRGWKNAVNLKTWEVNVHFNVNDSKFLYRSHLGDHTLSPCKSVSDRYLRIFRRIVFKQEEKNCFRDKVVDRITRLLCNLPMVLN